MFGSSELRPLPTSVAFGGWNSSLMSRTTLLQIASSCRRWDSETSSPCRQTWRENAATRLLKVELDPEVAPGGVRCWPAVEPAGQAAARVGVERFGPQHLSATGAEVHPAPRATDQRPTADRPQCRAPGEHGSDGHSSARRALATSTGCGAGARAARVSGTADPSGDGWTHCHTRWHPYSSCFSALRDPKERLEALLHFYEATAQFGCAVLLSILRADPELLALCTASISRAGWPSGIIVLDRAEFGLWTTLGPVLAKAIRRIKGQPELRPRLEEAAGPALSSWSGWLASASGRCSIKHGESATRASTAG